MPHDSTFIHRRPPSPSTNSLIAHLAAVDLRSDRRAFADWLARKNAARRSALSSTTVSRGTTRSASPVHDACFKSSVSADDCAAPLSHSSLNPIALPSTARSNAQSPQQTLDALFTKRANNQKAFLEWLRKKEEAKVVQEEREKRRHQHEQEKRRAQHEQQQLHKKRQQEALARWRQEKAQIKAEKENSDAIEAAKRRQAELEKRRLAQDAFDAWKKEKASLSPSATEIPFARHSQRWIDVVPMKTFGGNSSKIRHSAKGAHELLSPPNLYKDFPLYVATAPNYILKYPYQVASGGIGLPLNAFETSIVPPKVGPVVLQASKQKSQHHRK